MIGRRRVLEALAGIALAPALVGRARAQAPRPPLDPALVRALATSPFVYVCPLRADGAESSCHAEVWYAWLDGSVVLTTAATTWKARSLARGLARARLWVGDHGRWKRFGVQNDAFRAAPSFVARAELARDAGLIDRLLEAYERKYPTEIARWRGPMREGQRDGSRVLIRYRPEPASGPSART